jgi:hypothetical protein
MDEDGEAFAEEEIVAKQNDEAPVEATKEEQLQANLGYKTTTNTPTKRPARSNCWESTRRFTGDHRKAKEHGGSHTQVYTDEIFLCFYKLA